MRGIFRNKDLIILLLPSVAFLVLIFILPFFYGLYLSFTTREGVFTLDNYILFFSDSFEYGTIWITLILSVPITIISTAAAIPFAYYMRRGMKREKLITFFLIIPTTLGTVLIAQGMLKYMGPKGWFNQFLMLLGIVSEPARLTHNYAGVAISLFIQTFPFGFLLMLGYISGINPNLENASRMLGANWMKTFWKVMFPLMAPGTAIVFCLNFTACFSVFPSAVMLGQPSGQTRVIAYAAYQWAYEKYNENMGSAICIIMIIIQMIIVMLVLYGREKLHKSASIIGGKG